MAATELDKMVQRTRRLMQDLLAALGVEDVTTTVDSEDPDFVRIAVDGWGIGIDVGRSIKLRSIAGGREIPGYLVWYTITHPATRNRQEEVDDFTEIETHVLTDALQSLGGLVVRQRLSEVILAYHGPEGL